MDNTGGTINSSVVAVPARERYRCIAKLGSGGMADVYIGVQLAEGEFRRLVVIKRIHRSWLGNDNAAKMFIQEARTVASLNHPHIVKIIDLIRLEKDVGIVMEYVDGEHLDLIRSASAKSQHSIPLPIVCRFLVEAGEALHYAHSTVTPEGKPLNLIHRDVGANNLMLDRNGFLQIIDFGIAKSSTQTDLTMPGIFKGKFSYMAPDVFQYPDIDRRVDIYALGLVLFELTTLRRAFPFKDDVTVAEVIQRVVHENLPSVRLRVPSAPAQLDNIIQKATEKDRDRRYPTAEAMVKDLRALADSLGGLPANTEVASWFAGEFRLRIEKRKEFERLAIKRAQQIAEAKEIPFEEGSSGLRSNQAQTINSLQAPISSSIQTLPSKRVNPYLFILLVFVLIAGTAFVIRELFWKTSEEPTASPETSAFSRNLFVRAEPADALLLVDGTLIGPIAKEGLELRVDPGREHSIEIRKDGFEPYRLRAVGEVTGQRRIEAILVASPTPPSPESTQPILHEPAAVVAGPKPGPQPLPLGRKPTRSALDPRKTVPAEKNEPPSKPAPAEPNRPVEVLAVETPPERETLPVSSQPADGETQRPPTPEPKPSATIAQAEAKHEFYSGAGQWTGEQVLSLGCSRCHNGSKAPALDYGSKTKAQWEHFFARKRHNKVISLSGVFSAGELKRALDTIISRIPQSKATGISGVK